MRPFQAPALRPQRAASVGRPRSLTRSGERTSRNESYAHCLLSRFVVGAVPIRWDAHPARCGRSTVRGPNRSSSTKKSSESKQTSAAKPLQLARLPRSLLRPALQPLALRCFQAAARSKLVPRTALAWSGQYGFRHLSQARHALLRQDQARQIHVGSRRHQAGYRAAGKN